VAITPVRFRDPETAARLLAELYKEQAFHYAAHMLGIATVDGNQADAGWWREVIDLLDHLEHGSRK
jgi:hypothetical protein